MSRSSRLATGADRGVGGCTRQGFSAGCIGRLAACCLGVCLVLLVVSCGGRPQSQPTPELPSARSLRELCDRQLGRAEAPLKVETVLPVTNGCQDGIGFYLADLAAARPDLFSVRVYDMKSEGGHAVMTRNRIKCAAVIVNGTTRFDLGSRGGKVLLEGPMDPLDVYVVLSALVQDVSPAPQFVLPEPKACDAPTEAQRREAGF